MLAQAARAARHDGVLGHPRQSSQRPADAVTAVDLAVALEARKTGDCFHFGADCSAAALALGLAAGTVAG